MPNPSSASTLTIELSKYLEYAHGSKKSSIFGNSPLFFRLVFSGRWMGLIGSLLSRSIVASLHTSTPFCFPNDRTAFDEFPTFPHPSRRKQLFERLDKIEGSPKQSHELIPTTSTIPPPPYSLQRSKNRTLPWRHETTTCFGPEQKIQPAKVFRIDRKWFLPTHRPPRMPGMR